MKNEVVFEYSSEIYLLSLLAGLLTSGSGRYTEAGQSSGTPHTPLKALLIMQVAGRAVFHASSSVYSCSDIMGHIFIVVREQTGVSLQTKSTISVH